MKFDLNLYSLTYQQGQLQDDVPGFYVWTAPKRAARGRQDDILILLITLKEEQALTEVEKAILLEKITNDFFNSSGSVTTALRMVIDTINLSLLERNLRINENHERISADILLSVIHFDTIFIAQSGLAHGYLLDHNGLVHFHDSEVGERGLGLSRMPKIKYYQNPIEDRAFLIFTPTPPAAWQSENLIRNDRPNLDQLWRRLHHQIPKDQIAGLVQIIAGSGNVNKVSYGKKEEKTQLQPESILDHSLVEKNAELDALINDESEIYSKDHQSFENINKDKEAVKVIKVDNGIAGEGILYQQVPEDEELVQDDIEENQIQENEVETRDPQIFKTSYRNIEVGGLLKDHSEPPLPGEKLIKQKKFKTIDLRKVSHSLLVSISKALSYVNSSSKKFGSKGKLKDIDLTKSSTGHLSRGMMLLIAIIIPFLVVALAASVYLSRGRNKEYQLYYELGQAAAYNAELFSNPVDQRNAWSDAIKYTNLALSYKYTEEANKLLRQSRFELDELDGAVRLIFEPAYMIDDLIGLNISKIIPFAADLYLLDSSAGQVIQLTLGKRGYEVNSGFLCSAGTYNGITVGRLVELLSIPQSNPHKAPIVALDANGNLLYCANGKDPIGTTLVEPELGWGTIKAAAYNSYYDTLLILDSENNEIWIYRGMISSLETTPAPYFEKFPHDLTTAIDFDTNIDELYVLYADGHMSRCISSDLAGIDTKCTDPLVYKDARNDVEGFDFSTKKFTQVSYSGPLDPSLFLLSPDDTAIYQFSLLLNLNRIYRSDYAQQGIIGQVPTAFAISSNRNAFLAFGNQLFYAIFP